MVGYALRATLAVAGLAAFVAAGSGCDSESSEDSPAQPKTKKQAQNEGATSGAQASGDEEGDESGPSGSSDEGDEPAGKPGWEVQLSGPVSADVSGPSVLRKRAGVETRQIVLAGVPTQSAGPDNRMAISLSAFDEKGAKTYGASGVEAYFGSVKMTCRHPAEQKGGKRSKLRVEITAVSESRLAGTFEGVLQCERVREEGEEKKEPKPVFVEISGRFLDV